MRIGTWNLAGRWTLHHEALLLQNRCDVWLLTEVSDSVRLPGFADVRTTRPMAPGCAWAGIFSTGALASLGEPHGASVAARSDGVVFCSSVLPWRSCGDGDPWKGERHADKTEEAVRSVLQGLPEGELVWGGDWNHSLSGTEFAGSNGGRQHVKDALAARNLDAPTAKEPHQLAGCLSIDHVAVPASWSKDDVEHVSAVGLSDHDLYVVEAAPG